ncbi:hypothetical protein CW304_16395 [Bacillus sp. UFRGS-B20]|nr:hypothetical protein CW304_16395 [Bacillus sp. UFRGS-B20]
MSCIYFIPKLLSVSTTVRKRAMFESCPSISLQLFFISHLFHYIESLLVESLLLCSLTHIVHISRLRVNFRRSRTSLLGHECSFDFVHNRSRS